MRPIVYSLFLMLFFASQCFAGSIQNFSLLDHEGNYHELYSYSDYKALVLLTYGVGCPIARKTLADLKSLQNEFKNKVKFLLIDSNLQDSRKVLNEEVNEFNIQFPILHDESQLVGELLSANRTAEAFLINTETWSVDYRGPINNRLFYEGETREEIQHYLKDSIQSVLKKKAVKMPKINSLGCLINFVGKKRDSREISYSKTIAPILKKSCTRCHNINGVAPWPMTSYKKVLGYSLMIKEVLLTKRMPPWFADPHVGKFKYDYSISSEEKRKIIHWIDQGSPRGKGEDPLKKTKPINRNWPNGRPDIIIKIPKTEVPANGILPYQHRTVKNILPYDAWIKSSYTRPEHPQALHHSKMMKGYNNKNDMFSGTITMYVPGGEWLEFPPDTAVFLPKNSSVNFILHYTTFGKKITDNSEGGTLPHQEAAKIRIKTFRSKRQSYLYPFRKKETFRDILCDN